MLEELKQQVLSCSKCPLHQTRSNVVFGNGNPDAEKNACVPYLFSQIETINPKIIILLGATALKGLIDPNAKITQVRGQWIHWETRWVMPTYHPSALLRNQHLKRPVWTDFKTVVIKYRELVNPEHYSAYVK